MSEPEDEGSSEEERFPPWLASIVQVETGQFPDDVEVLEEGGTDEKRPGLTPCQSIILPEPRQAAKQGNKGQCRMVTVSKYSTVLIAAGPEDPPYIGIVEQIWRKSDAGRDVGGKRLYKPKDFGVECYWFYRPQEVPETAWQGTTLKPLAGSARFKYDMRGAKMTTERWSERTVLFSSHHTAHDYPSADSSDFGAGILPFEGFLQKAEVHWPGPQDQPPQRYCIHGGKLLLKPEPGFVVRGFLWCNAKKKVMFDEAFKQVFTLEQDWKDAPTKAIVRYMQARYTQGRARRRAQQKTMLDKYAALMSGATRSPSADGSDSQQQDRGTAAAARAAGNGKAPASDPAAGAAAAGAAAAARGGGGAAAAGAGAAGVPAPVSSPQLPGMEAGPMPSPPGLVLPPAGAFDDMDDDDD